MSVLRPLQERNSFSYLSLTKRKGKGGKNEEGERKEEEDFFSLSASPESPRMFFLLTLCAPPAISKVKPIK